MRLFGADGTVSIAEKQGKPQKVKDVSNENKKKQICLNCNKPKCTGNCKKVTEAGNEN